MGIKGHLGLKMTETVAKVRIELKKSQVLYNKNVARTIKRGNVECIEGDYLWIDVQDGM